MSVTKIPLLRDLQGPWSKLQVEMMGIGLTQIDDVYPFISVTDLKRLIWLQQDGDSRWAPERVFLGVRSEAGIRPLEFHWPATVTNGSIDLQDPMAISPAPNPALVDEAGNRRPVAPTMIGSLILEAALSPELLTTGVLPILVAIPLAALTPSDPSILTSAIYNGFYLLYFPWLAAPAQILDAATKTPAIKEAYAAAAVYTEERTGRISAVQKALGAAGSSVLMTTMVRLRWTLPPPPVKPESLELRFYGIHASAVIPFMRYFSAGGKTAPLMKLGLKPDGMPIIDNDKLLTQFLNHPPPVTKSAVILARIPLVSAHVGVGIAFTLNMFEDGNSDITLEVPQKGATYIAAVAGEAQHALADIMVSIGYPPGTTPVLRDLHATYKWTHPDPRRSSPLSATRLQQRVAALTPFLESPLEKDKDEIALATFRWRAVSNYESESAQFSFISAQVEKGNDLPTIASLIVERYGLSKAAATVVVENWIERHADAVAPATGPLAGTLAVPRHSSGVSISITGSHPDYMLELKGVDSYSDLQRILSVMGVLLGASSVDLSIEPPVKQVQAVATSVAIADVATASNSSASSAPDVEVGEMDPALADLLGDLGFGGEDEGEGEGEGEEGAAEATEAPQIQAQSQAPPPDLDAAVAAVEEECSGTPWTAGEAPLKLRPDYYIHRLGNRDNIMFSFSSDVAGRAKSYSKSCQRSDGRQPNIMTLAEYARVKRCYEDRVRFVNLPPRSAADLPVIPGYKKNKHLDAKDFETDPTPGPTQGWPLWSVYGYSSKTDPGRYLYLMCAELWCERDNLPILRREYETNGSRCPFCGGSEITNFASPKSGESVVVRKSKKSTEKLHQYVGVIMRNKHPQGYSLPCCDTTPRLLELYMKAMHAGTIEYGRDISEDDDSEEALASVAAAAIAEEPEPEPELGLRPAGSEAATGKAIGYRRIFGSMQTQYLLGNDKVLSAGKLGQLPPILDAFFGQNSPRSIKYHGIRPTFAESAILFVRLGVDNRIPTPGLNLFAGLAPLLGTDSAEECQQQIMTQRMVRAFEAANYGTLVQEFAAISMMSEAEITRSLPTFAAENGYTLDTGRAHVVRLYKAWVEYLKYIADIYRPKRLRHFEHLLAQPGVITGRGLLLVTLEQRGDRIDVVCPSFGIPMASVFGDVPIAFLWHDRRDESWEPLILYNGTKDAVRFFGERSPDLEVVPSHLRQGLQRWLRDWRSSTRGCGRPVPPPHVWTPDRDTRDLPRLSQLRARMEGISVTAMVRDRSNRLAGVLFKMAGGQILFVPCLDDGSLAPELTRVYEVEGIPAAPIDAYMRFYGILATTYPGLKPTEILIRSAGEGSEQQIVGFRLAVGSVVPVAPAPRGSFSGLPEQPVDAFPWERDALVLKSPDAIGPMGAILEESTASVEEQLEEAYQYVRLTLSRWLVRDARGPAKRNELEAIRRSNLPLYEKRKRTDIALEPLLHEWILVERKDKRAPMPILRQDCLALKGATCAASSACRWTTKSGGNSAASAASEGSGRCLIHAPTRGEESSVFRIFTARLSDELLRYSSLRHEILDDHVQMIRTPKGVVRVGDELFLSTKPKENATSILSRLGFTGDVAIRFPEEMLRFEGAEEEGEEVVPPIGQVESLPAAWTATGFQIASPPADLEDAERLAFAQGTGYSISQWESFIQKRRKDLKLAGDPNRPFQWSQQDFYIIAIITHSNVVFAHVDATGKTVIDQWFQPPDYGTVSKEKQLFMTFWGARQLLISKGRIFRFTMKDLPSDFLDAMDSTSPMSNASVTTEPIPLTSLSGNSSASVSFPVPQPAPQPAPVSRPQQQTIPAPQQTIPAPQPSNSASSAPSRPTIPAPSVSSRPTIPAPASRPTIPAPSASSVSSAPVSRPAPELVISELPAQQQLTPVTEEKTEQKTGSEESEEKEPAESKAEETEEQPAEESEEKQEEQPAEESEEKQEEQPAGEVEQESEEAPPSYTVPPPPPK